MTNLNFDSSLPSGHDDKTYLHRPAIIIVAALIMIIASAMVLWPVVVRQQSQDHVQVIFAKESAPLVDSLSVIAGESSSKSQCQGWRHSYWRTTTLCQAFRVYPYNPTHIPAERRQDIAAHAKELDGLLKAHGWTVDRPNDPITTIAGSLPSAPLPAGYSTQSVPFHKNVGEISCNLKISFTGPSNGQSPGIIMVDEFSCQQNSSCFQFHPDGPWASPGI
jgi:hypothetical protein